MNSIKTVKTSLKSTCLALLVAFGSSLLPAPVAAAEWIVEGDSVTFVDNVGFNPEGTAFSGTIALRMDNVVVSGQLKIVTTILSIIPEPGFTYSIKKSGGVNGSVEIQFASATASSKFSFLYKPGQTKIDYGVMRSR